MCAASSAEIKTKAAKQDGKERQKETKEHRRIEGEREKWLYKFVAHDTVLSICVSLGFYFVFFGSPINNNHKYIYI